MDWQDISTAPKDGTAILTYRKTGFQAVCEWYAHEQKWIVTDGCVLIGVTHWMPLPLPPPPTEKE